MSTRNFIGSGQNSAKTPLLDRDGQRVQQLRRVVDYLTRLNTAHRVMCLYVNGILCVIFPYTMCMNTSLIIPWYDYKNGPS